MYLWLHVVINSHALPALSQSTSQSFKSPKILTGKVITWNETESSIKSIVHSTKAKCNSFILRVKLKIMLKLKIYPIHHGNRQQIIIKLSTCNAAHLQTYMFQFHDILHYILQDNVSSITLYYWRLGNRKELNTSRCRSIHRRNVPECVIK